MPEGEVRFAAGIEAVGAAGGGGSGTAPQGEFALRYGLTEDLDVGAKLYFLGAEVGMKYQLVRGDVDLAIAPAMSGFSYSASVDDGTGESEDASITFLYFHLPLLTGVDLSDRVTIGFGPKLLYALAIGDTSATDTEVFDGMAGGGYAQLALRVGDAFWIAPEINVYTPMTGDGAFDGVIWQGGVGLMFGGGPRQASASPPPEPQVPAGY